MNFLHGVPNVCASALISFSFHALNSDLSDPSFFGAATLLLSLIGLFACAYVGLVTIVATCFAVWCCSALTISTVLATFLLNRTTYSAKVSGSVPTSLALAAIW